MNCKSTLASKTQSFMPSIRFIPILSLLVIVSFTTLSYAEFPPPLKQIQAGIAPEDIQCNADFVHVVYSEKHACVTEQTALKMQERMGWEIVTSFAPDFSDIEHFFNNIPEVTYVAENTLFFDQNTVSSSSGISSEPSHPCQPSVTFEVPETFKVGSPFEIKYSWTWILYNGDFDGFDDDDAYEIDSYICGKASDKQKEDILGGIAFTTFPGTKILDSTHEFKTIQRFDHYLNFPYEDHIHVAKYDASKDHTGTITVVFDKEYEFPLDWMRVLLGPNIGFELYTTFDGSIGKLSKTDRSDTAKEYYKALVDDVPKFEQLRNEYKKLGNQLAKEYKEQNPEKFIKKEVQPKEPKYNTPPSGPHTVPRYDWPDFANFIANYTDVSDVRQFLLDENFEKNFIEEFLNEFPDLKKTIDRTIANFILPFAFAQTIPHVWVTGYYDFLDENGTATDASRVNVCLYDANSNGTSFALLYNGATAGCEELDDNGFYSISVGNVDTDDPTTGADITPIFSFNTTSQVITNYDNTVYDIRGDINSNVNGTWLIIGSEVNTNSTLDKVFRIHDTIDEGYDFFKDDLGYTPEQVTIWYDDDSFLGSTGGAYYATFSNRIVLTGDSDADEQHEERPYTILHEYGHFIMDKIYNDSFNQGKCPTTGHSINLNSNDEYAWTEGWADFVPLVVFNSSNYERTPTVIYNIEDRTYGSSTFDSGIGTEGNIAALLWDIMDNANEQDVGGDTAKDDDIQNGISDIWDVTDDPLNTGETQPAQTILDFISDWDDEVGLQSLATVGYLNTMNLSQNSKNCQNSSKYLIPNSFVLA